MYDFNPLKRITDLDELLNEYEQVLSENGVLTRLNKGFINNTLTLSSRQDNNEQASYVPIKKRNTKKKFLSASLTKLADKDATQLLSKSPNSIFKKTRKNFHI
jgi:hypothetical protein